MCGETQEEEGRQSRMGLKGCGWEPAAGRDFSHSAALAAFGIFHPTAQASPGALLSKVSKTCLDPLGLAHCVGFTSNLV